MDNTLGEKRDSQDWQEIHLDDVANTQSPRARIDTNASTNLSQMESSWEDVHPGSVPVLPHSRTSSTGSYSRNTKSKKSSDLKSRLVRFLRPHSRRSLELHRTQEILMEKNEVYQQTVGRDGRSFNGSLDPASVADLTAATESAVANHENRLSTTVESEENVTALPRHLRIARTRLSVSESDSRTARTQFSKGRSLSTVGDSPIVKSVPPYHYRNTENQRRTRRNVSKQNRTIGIVGGEDFIMNPTSGDKLVDYINSAWNNVKYGWNVKPKVHLSLKSSIWIFGEIYTAGNNPHSEEKAAVYKSFVKDFKTRLWFTYRRDFSALAGTTLTSDCGWGCMLRSGQMMLSEALVLHFLKRDWRWDKECNTRDQEVYHRQIVKWCGDSSSHDQLFGLHKLVAVGQKCGKRAGDWYGPGSVAHIVQKAMTSARETNPLLKDIQVYVAQDCTIFKGDIRDIQAKGLSTGTELALIILVPVRLGGGRINPVYLPCLRNLLTIKYSIGIIGGRPRHSLYFVGWQDNSVIYLDPHFCQDTVDVSERNFKLDSYHCSSPRKLAMKNMDPSCTLGFYCRDRDEYEDFIRTVSEVQTLYCKDFPMFTFSDGRISDYDRQGLDLKSFEADAVVQSSVIPFKTPETVPSTSSSSKVKEIEESVEFVVL